MDRTFVGASRRLDDIDLPKLGIRLGGGEDELHAFLDVETRGHGFDELGRPIILFEPHVFYRNLTGEKRNQAVKEGLAYKNWGAKPYGKESEQYPKLKRACLIDETAALKACSWGLGQVLGENHAAAGFATVQAMAAAMMADEEFQLEASVNFILSNKLDDELRRHDWAAFAKGYNGKEYARNKYDAKLAEAFRKWSRIKDTPLPKEWPLDAPQSPPAIPEQAVPEPLPAPAPEAAAPKIERQPPPPPDDRGEVERNPIWKLFLAILAAVFGRGKS